MEEGKDVMLLILSPFERCPDFRKDDDCQGFPIRNDVGIKSLDHLLEESLSHLVVFLLGGDTTNSDE